MSHIAALVRGVEVQAERIEPTDKEAVAVQRTSDALVKIPLVPLMRQDDPPEDVLEKCAERLESEVAAQDERAILYVALAALSSLRFSKELILKVLEVSKLENLPLFDGIREQWEAKGEARGEAKGEARGEVKGRLDTLFDVLEAKFGKVPDDLRSQLSELKDPVTINY